MDETWWVKPEQLNDEQKAIVRLPIKDSHLIVGPPGCGKTNLILLRANHLVLSGRKNIQVLVYTRTLREFIARGGAKYAFSEEKLLTSQKWFRSFLWENGDKEKPPDDFDEQRLFNIERTLKLITDRKLDKLYETILLDEAQDYLPEEIEIFGKVARTIYAVADSRQKLYKGEDSIKTIENLPSKTHQLRYHYRNGRNICKLADGIAKYTSEHEPLTATSNYDEASRPSSVKVHQCNSIEEQADRIVKELTQQLKAYPDELLGVMCPRHKELTVIWDRIAASPLADSAVFQDVHGYIPFEDGKPICVSTLHNAKGLEFRAVHVAGAEFVKKSPYQRNMAYTAVTRAKTSVAIYHCANLPGYVEQALAGLEPDPDPPDLSQVFGGKK